MPPYSTLAYRGYWIVQQTQGAGWDILAVDAEKLSGSRTLEGATLIVDEWLDAK